MGFKYNFEKKENYAFINIQGSLLSVFDGTEMLETVDKDLAGCKNFIVDMSKVNHLSSEGLNVLLNLLTKSRNAGGDTYLCNLSTHVQSLFIITKLSNIFTITKNKKQAVEKIKTAV
jgi:anti-anti-sigma factor